MSADNCLSADELPLIPGFDWRAEVEFAASIRADADLVAHVRRRVSSATILATLTSDDDELVVTGDKTVEVFISAATSAAWAHGFVYLDFVDRKVSGDEYLGGPVEIPVKLSVTRGLE